MTHQDVDNYKQNKRVCLTSDWALCTAVSCYQLSLTKVYQRPSEISVTLKIPCYRGRAGPV